MDATGFVTAGGRSSRMGRDKAWLELGGKSLIEHVIAALAPVVSEVKIIANDENYSQLGLPVLADDTRDIGPAEAIRTALANSSTRDVLLVGCDMPFVTPDLFEVLLGEFQGWQAAILIGPDGRAEPVCAAYSRDALETFTSLIDAGERKLSTFYSRLRTKLIPYQSLQKIPGAEYFFFNVNSPEDYEKAKVIFETIANRL